MRTDHDELMAGVLGEEESFRREVLAQTLHGVRRRQAARKRNRALALVCAPVLITALLVLQTYRGMRNIPQPEMVQTLPTVEMPRLYDIPQSASPTLISSSTEGLEMIQSGAGSVAMLQTVIVPGQIEFLSDEQLLALFPGRPAALIGTGPSHKQLILLDEPAPGAH